MTGAWPGGLNAWVTRHAGRLAAGVVLLQMLAGLYLVRRLPLDGNEFADIGGRIYQTISYAERGQTHGEVHFAGERLDPQHRLIGFWFRPVGGRVYSIFPPWWALCQAPFFRAWGLPGVYLLPLLGALACSGLTWFCAGPGWRRERLAAVVLVAGASPLFIFGLQPWEHSVAAAGGLAAFVLLRQRWPRGALLAAALAGLVAGAATLLRAELLFWDGLLGLGLALNTRRADRWPLLLAFGSGCVAVFWLGAAANLHWYGSPLSLHLRQAHEGIPDASRWQRIVVLCRYTLVPDQARCQLLALAALSSALLLRLPRLDRLTRALLDGANLVALLAFAVLLQRAGQESGLFTSSPWLLLALRPLPWPRQEPPDEQPAALLELPQVYLAVLGLLLLVLLLAPTHPGRIWGPRYLLVILPPAAWLLLRGLAASRGRRRTLEVGLLLALAAVAVVALLGQLRFIERRRLDYGGFERILRDLPEARRVVVSDLPYMPLLCYRIGQTRPILTVRSGDDLQYAAQRLHQHGEPFLLVTRWPEIWRRNRHYRYTRLREYRPLGVTLLQVWPAAP
ncbi:MAG: hypothetical protein IT204_09005 [Fimbriimonadaceae bacterium]|nr:hypothetical protein [Fimbriimonadaceae bacterium]